MMSHKSRRIAIMGFRSVGKSSLAIQFVNNQFVDYYDPTIENTFEKSFRSGNQDYNIQIVDTAGQDEYSILSQNCTMNVHGYVLVYSTTSQKSFEVVKIIHDKILDMTGSNQVPLVLVGNKTDLHMQRSVSTKEGKDLAESWKAAFIESSAKQHETVKEIFKTILLEIERQSGDAVDQKTSCTVS